MSQSNACWVEMERELFFIEDKALLSSSRPSSSAGRWRNKVWKIVLRFLWDRPRNDIITSTPMPLARILIMVLINYYRHVTYYMSTSGEKVKQFSEQVALLFHM